MRHKKTHYNVIMGDFNAKVGKGDEDCVGSFGYGVRNDRGDDLINFATAHGFKIMNTYYKKKKNRRWTWRSPNFETFNEIDYVLVDKNNIVKNFEVLWMDRNGRAAPKETANSRKKQRISWRKEEISKHQQQLKKK